MDIDHLIMKVNDLEASVRFYTEIMAFRDEGLDGPFAVIRVSESFQLQLAPWGTEGFEHYAFSVSNEQFQQIFERIKQQGIEYGPSFHNVGTMLVPERRWVLVVLRPRSIFTILTNT